MIGSTDYRSRAQQHAPRTAAEIVEAARNLAREGHTDYTIAQILSLDVTAVRRLLGECRDCAE